MPSTESSADRRATHTPGPLGPGVSPMNEALEIRVYDRQQLVFSNDFEGVIELGRQRDSEERPHSHRLEGGRWRIVIARYDENTVSRDHARIEPLEDGRVRITNLSEKLPVRVNAPHAAELAPLAEARKNPALAVSCEAAIPAMLGLGQKSVRVEKAERSIEEELRTLAEATRRPGEVAPGGTGLLTLALPSTSQTETKQVLRWLKDTMDVLQNAASSNDFFRKTAQDVVDRVGLDAGVVLLLEDGAWKPQATHTAPNVRLDAEWLPSRQVLKRVHEERRTFFQAPGDSLDGQSLAGIKWVVAAPILDRKGEVIGAVYGDRRPGLRRLSAQTITEVEAMLVELLAGGVASGLTRLEHERRSVNFAQFFTKELATEFAENPDILLRGRDAEVSVLFGDIRGFSSISERLGPARTVEWINDVMGALSDCVLAEHGVLVDYIGDEIMAMWGAPHDQPEHAAMAVRAGLAMLSTIERLNEQWVDEIGERMGLGVGINTGIARVGNTGSRLKFKYGPLGNTVNLASRVQGATKYLKSWLLITDATRAKVGDDFHIRRLCKVSVVNIARPVELYEVVPSPQPASWQELRQHYETALADFEAGRFTEAARILSQTAIQSDRPSLILLSRAVDNLAEPPEAFDPVWKLPGK